MCTHAHTHTHTHTHTHMHACMLMYRSCPRGCLRRISFSIISQSAQRVSFLSHTGYVCVCVCVYRYVYMFVKRK